MFTPKNGNIDFGCVLRSKKVHNDAFTFELILLISVSAFFIYEM